MIQKDIEQTQKLIDELYERIKDLLAPYDNAVARLKEIPGLSTKVVEDLIAEIGKAPAPTTATSKSRQ